MKKEKKTQQPVVENRATEEPVLVAEAATAPVKTAPEEATGGETTREVEPEVASEVEPEGAGSEDPYKFYKTYKTYKTYKSYKGEGEDAQARVEEPEKSSADNPELVEELVREAYMRGRNEAIEVLMQRPGMLQPIRMTPATSRPQREEPEVMILNNPRPSIWDK